MDILVYNFERGTGAFISASRAAESPREPGEPLVPAYATLHVPPFTGPREVAVFSDADDAWSVKPDWRGVPLFVKETGVQMQITDIGVTPDVVGATDRQCPGPQYAWIDDGWRIDAAKVAALKAQAQDAAWVRIKAERDRRSDQGGYKVGDKWFHSDQKSRGQQLGLVVMGVQLPKGLMWKSLDGSFVPMTPSLAGGILAAGAASDQATFAAAEKHRAAMMAVDDPEQYDFSTGWPPIFGE